MKTLSVDLNGTTYEVNIIRKRVRNINYRFKDGKFYISCPIFCLTSTVLENLEITGPKLLKRTTNRKICLICRDFYYLYGQKYEGNTLKINNLEMHFHTKTEFYKLVKEQYLCLLNERVNYYKKLMNLNHNYLISVRYMKSRFGSNTIKQHRLHFNLLLVHFRLEIIDSVVVHELAHSIVPDHSNKFYSVVYKYCPNYNELTKELKRYIYD